MAHYMEREQFDGVTVDCEDMTLTEYGRDGAQVFDIMEVLGRWDGASDVTIIIERRTPISPTEEVE